MKASFFNVRTILLASACLCISGAVCAQSALEFSADYVSTGAQARGGHVTTGKIYVGDGKLRQLGQLDEHTAITVNDGQNTYTLVPEQKLAMFTPGRAGRGGTDIKQHDLSNPCAGQDGAVCAKVGAEVVGGRKCDSWDVTDKQGKKSTIWVDEKTRLVVKTVRADGSSFELKNIKVGKQDPNLFVVPPDYYKADMTLAHPPGQPPQP
jgi:outer membrane lipoprotein-sorting protein